MKTFFILFFTAFFLYTGSAYSNIMIAPTRMEVGLDKPTTESFVVMNTSTDKIKMAIVATAFDTKGITEKYDISKYLSINPKMISLNPNQSRTVRVTLRPDEELKKGKGEYYARILFKTVEKEQKKAPKKKITEEKNTVSMDIDLVFNVSIPVYGSLGKGTPEMKADCIVGKNGAMTAKVTNSGLWRFDGTMILTSPKDSTVELAKERILMPRGYTKEVELKLKPEDLKNDALPVNFVSLEDKMKVKIVSNSCSLKQLTAAVKGK